MAREIDVCSEELGDLEDGVLYASAHLSPFGSPANPTSHLCPISYLLASSSTFFLYQELTFLGTLLGSCLVNYILGSKLS